MALSKEEISIRLGINAKSVQAGLDSATGYISKWRKKQKTDEEAYTSFWVSEFKKREELAAAELDKRLEVAKAKRAKHAQEVANYEARLAKKAAGGQEYLASLKQKEELEVASAIRAAERSNKARMLWRERGAKRELRLAAETADKIAAAETAKANTFYNRSIGAASRKIEGIGKSLAAGAAIGGVMTLIGAITYLFDKATDEISKKFYDLIYGISENLEAIVEKNSSKWKGARSSQLKSWEDKKSMAQARRDDKFDRSTNLEKLYIVETELAAQEKIAKLAYDTWQIQIKKNKNAQSTFEAESKFYEEEKKRIDYAKSVRDQTAALTREEMVERLQFEWSLARSQKDRRAMAAIRSEIGLLTGQSLNPSSSGLKSTGMAAVDDYMSKIKSGQEAYKSKTDYSQFGKAIAEAQKEAATEFVQKVSIVEINEQ